MTLTLNCSFRKSNSSDNQTAAILVEMIFPNLIISTKCLLLLCYSAWYSSSIRSNALIRANDIALSRCRRSFSVENLQWRRRIEELLIPVQNARSALMRWCTVLFTLFSLCDHDRGSVSMNCEVNCGTAEFA